MVLTGRMRVTYKNGEVRETSYCLTHICWILLDESVVSYELEGRDY